MRPLVATALAAFLLAAGSPSLLAQEEQEALELTAEESVRRGLAHDARLRAAGADVEAAEAGERQVRAGRLPALRGQANATRLGSEIGEVEVELPGLEEPVSFFPVPRDRYHFEVSLEQALLTGGRLRQELEAAGERVEAAQGRAEQEAAEVAFEVRRAYWSLHQALAAREAVAAALELVEEHLRVVERRLEEGRALTSELLAARTRRSEVLLERVEAEDAIRVARLELNRRIGLPLAAEVRPVGEPEEARVPLDAEGDPWAPASLRASPALASLAAEARALGAQARAAEGARYPELSLVGRYLYARPNPFVVFEQDEFRGVWEVGLAAHWSLWEGGRRRARIAEARARTEAAEARLAEARLAQEVEVTRRELEVRRTSEAMTLAGETVVAAEEGLRVARRQFAEGVVLSAQVLEAEQAYRQARAREARAAAERAIAEAALLATLGRVW